MKGYIPKNKFDLDAVEKLKLLPFEVVKKDISKLLEWLQDMNWPVADGVARYLLPHLQEIKSELIDIFNTDDVMWKYWMMGILQESPHRVDDEILLTLKRIAENPSSYEVSEELDLRAKETILTLKIRFPR